jgi:hypothetical protein
VRTYVILLLTILLTACAPVIQTPRIQEVEFPPKLENSTSIDVTPSGSQINKRVDDPNEYRFPQLLPWDAILPVYDPIFVSAEEAPLADDELVIGIALGEEAKAYPITVLQFREMVNDELHGIPILVTW